MQSKPRPKHAARRPPGAGALILRRDAAGRETWYGKWRVGDRQSKRKLGPRRTAGSSLGLTRRQAEAELRRLLNDARTRPAVRERLTFAEAAERYLHHLEHVLERKRSTVTDTARSYADISRAFSPASRSIPSRRSCWWRTWRPSDAKACRPRPSTTILSLLHAIFRHAIKRGWARDNPVQMIDRPRQTGPDPDIRALDPEELEALIRAAPNDTLGATDAVLYLAAATTGLRQGELAALRWRDVDWSAGVVRVRRSYTRGEWGRPKSRRSSRAVPLADRLAAELDRHFQRSTRQGDDELVFGHPLTGAPYDASKMRKRFKEALDRAGVRPVRFHDLRHTFGTRMAAAGAPLRFIQEWMGHRDYKTTSIYADYAPDPARGAALANQAFAATNLEQPASARPAIGPSESLPVLHLPTPGTGP